MLICVLSLFLVNAQTWTQLGSDIVGHSNWRYDWTPVSLSSDGTTISVGGPYNYTANGASSGQVRTYKYISGVWTVVGGEIDGEAAADNSGQFLSTSCDGNIVAIGAPFNDSHGNGKSGHVRVYENVSGTWTQIGSDIDGEASDDYSGWAVSVNCDGTKVAIGAPNHDNFKGQVRIFENISGSWTQIGTDIDGDTALNQFGYRVSLSNDGTTVAIGAIRNSDSGALSGHVKIFKDSSGTWTQVGADINGEAAGDQSGFRVSLSSDASIVAIGAPFNDGNGSNSGHVRIYKNISGTWTQIGSDIDGENPGDGSGCAVSLSSDGSKIAIGAQYNVGDSATASHHGHVRIYENISGTWTQVGADINGSNLEGRFGYSVSLGSNGDTVAVGAYPGYTRVYFLCETESSIDTISSCAPYLWTNGISYWSSDTSATDTFVNTAGCDSIVTLNLTILPSSNDTLVISECNSYTSSTGMTWKTSGIYNLDTFTNTAGCDSIINIDLTILNSTAETLTLSECNSYTSPSGKTWTSSNTYQDTITNSVGCDSVLTINLTILDSTSNSLILSACFSYTSPSGKTWTSSGQHLDTLTNSIGCDSIVTYNLTIVAKDDIITLGPVNQRVSASSNATFIVNSLYTSTATYQWQTDQGLGFQNVSNAGQYSGANNDTLVVANVSASNENHAFRCIVVANDCSDTSETVTLTLRGASITDVSKKQLYSLYPNPTGGVIHIQATAKQIGASYTVYSSEGQILFNGEITGVDTEVPLHNLSEGVYIFSIGDGIKQVFRVLKK